MLSFYDEAVSGWRLQANAFGWGAFSLELENPPPGCVRACYAMKYWIDELTVATDHVISSPGWNTTAFVGLGFDDTVDGLTDFDGFVGHVGSSTLNVPAETYARISCQVAGGTGTYLASIAGSYASSYRARMMNGLGGQIASTFRQSTTEYNAYATALPYLGIPISEARGQIYTVLWEIIKDEGATNRVRMNARINSDSLSLAALDFDATDPTVLIPASSGFQSTNDELNAAAAYGNHWIATDGGPLLLPTHAKVRWPFADVGKDFVFGGIKTKYYSAL